MTKPNWMIRVANWGRDGGDTLLAVLCAFGAGVVVGIALMGGF